jgi:GTP cyclohydrolase I
MNTRDPGFLPDVQAAADGRNIVIQRVGIRAIKLPVSIASPQGPQHSIATISMYVMLPGDQKGTHMSRFIELLEAQREPFDGAGLRRMLAELTTRLASTRGQITVSFPFFVEKTAPVSGASSLLDYDVTLAGKIDQGRTQVRLRVVAPVTSLCPCSKEISEYGAHNQRSHVSIDVEVLHDVKIEDLLAIAEQEASSQLYGLLKRPDEKFVTERAYENPKFVEDLVRDVARRLEEDERIGEYTLEVENFESIHNHSAFARIEGDRRKRAARA